MTLSQHREKKQEHRLNWATILATFLLSAVLTSIVPFAAWVHRPADSMYSGATYESVADIFYYLNLIDQARHGNILLHNFYNPLQAHEGGFFHPLFWTLGTFARLTGIPLLALWHVARIVAQFFLIIVLYQWISQVAHTENQRRITLLATLFLGSAFSLTYEGSLFLAMEFSPLVELTVLATLLFFTGFLKLMRQERRLFWSIFLPLLALLQAMSHPYVLIVWFTVTGAYFLARFFLGSVEQSNFVRIILVLFLSAAAAFGYLYLGVYQQTSVLQLAVRVRITAWAWTDIVFFLLGSGPLALFGLWAYRQRLWKDPHALFHTVWIFTLFALSISPYLYAGRLPFFLLVPLAFFASYGAQWLWKLGKNRVALRALVLIFIVIALSDNMRHVAVGVQGQFPLASFQYVDKATQRGLKWVREHTEQNATFLTSDNWDTLFAERAYRHVYTSAGGLTDDVSNRVQASLEIYGGNFPTRALYNFVQLSHIQYVVVSSLERQTGSMEAVRLHNASLAQSYHFRFQPSEYPFLSVVYDTDGFTVYHVIIPQPS